MKITITIIRNRKIKNKNILLLSILLSYSICHAQERNSINSCFLAKDLNKNYTKINSDTLKTVLLKSNDKCNTIFVDSLVKNFVHRTDFKSFKMLQNFSNYCDGYLSDYLVERISEIYNKKFIEIFNFLYIDRKNKRNIMLENFLVENWSNISSLSDNVNAEVKKIKSKTINDVMNFRGDNCKLRINYLNSLLKRINPEYLD